MNFEPDSERLYSENLNVIYGTWKFYIEYNNAMIWFISA